MYLTVMCAATIKDRHLQTPVLLQLASCHLQSCLLVSWLAWSSCSGVPLCLETVLQPMVNQQATSNCTFYACSYLQDYEEKNSATYKGLDLRTMSMAQLYQHFGLDAQTIDFIGHALALHRDDSYLDQPALPTALKIKLYHDSLTRYDGLTSPYIYPRYGLGELPQVCLHACCQQDTSRASCRV